MRSPGLCCCHSCGIEYLGQIVKQRLRWNPRNVFHLKPGMIEHCGMQVWHTSSTVPCVPSECSVLRSAWRGVELETAP